MIGGIIVLALFLMSLVAMIVLSQQYDVYRATADYVEQKYIDRYSEKLVGSYPGFQGPPGIVNGNINQYAMLVTNVGGIGSQIARVYITSNTSMVSHGCSVTCILDPSASIRANSFNTSQSYVIPGEFSHKLLLWLPQNIVMMPQDPSGSHSVSIVTSRGQVVTFHYPFPPTSGSGSGAAGGTGIFIGPLVIKYKAVMITYTTDKLIYPPLPIGGGWQFPYVGLGGGGNKNPIIFFVEVMNQGNNTVRMTSQSNLQVAKFGSPGSVQNYWIIAPMTWSLCVGTGTNGFSGDTIATNYKTVDCRSSKDTQGTPLILTGSPHGNQYPQTGGGSPTIFNYDFTSAPYIIYPNASQAGVCCGKPVYLLFSAQSNGNAISNTAGSIPGSYEGPIITFLNLGFQYDDGSGMYTWGVNLPFIGACAGNFTTTLNCKP